MPSQPPADEPMPDAQAQPDGAAADADNQPQGMRELRLQALPGATDTAASFEFLNEDHTMGNALRYMIMKNPEVEFCGYSIPHPAEAKMNVRIQTYEGTTVWDALAKGMDDLMDLCNVVEEKFVQARNDFEQDRMQS
ncbi:MAG: hypothetical protein LQ340_005080 [Diploschistes diacapsis]|nr:MAG: hypothetical protein LQ340_005080 [Diploschistes diacapsis]